MVVIKGISNVRSIATNLKRRIVKDDIRASPRIVKKVRIQNLQSILVQEDTTLSDFDQTINPYETIRRKISTS